MDPTLPCLEASTPMHRPTWSAALLLAPLLLCPREASACVGLGCLDPWRPAPNGGVTPANAPALALSADGAPLYLPDAGSGADLGLALLRAKRGSDRARRGLGARAAGAAAAAPRRAPGLGDAAPALPDALRGPRRRRGALRGELHHDRSAAAARHAGAVLGEVAGPRDGSGLRVDDLRWFHFRGLRPVRLPALVCARPLPAADALVAVHRRGAVGEPGDRRDARRRPVGPDSPVSMRRSTWTGGCCRCTARARPAPRARARTWTWASAWADTRGAEGAGRGHGPGVDGVDHLHARLRRPFADADAHRGRQPLAAPGSDGLRLLRLAHALVVSGGAPLRTAAGAAFCGVTSHRAAEEDLTPPSRPGSPSEVLHR